jgi:quercetin dioxygenase-like cupin family protein
MTKPLRFLCTAAAITLPLVALTVVAAQQIVTQRFPQFENDDVKVWRSVIAPGTPLPAHHHDHGRVIIPLEGGSIDVVEQDGTKEHHPWEAGKAYWLPMNAPGTMHQDVNTGTKPVVVMVVELKKDLQTK